MISEDQDYISKFSTVDSDVLSARETEVLQLISDGLSNIEIALRLDLSPHTAKAHTRNIYEKLGVSSRTQAVAIGVRMGLINRPH